MTITTIADIKPAVKNARVRTERGAAMIARSIEENGFGRSVLLAADGSLIAGSGTIDGCADVGLEDVQIVDSDGTKIIAVRRTDVAPGSERAHKLAIADNRTTDLSDFDPAVVAALANEVDLSDFWRDDELDALLAGIETDAVPVGDDPGADFSRADALVDEYGVADGQIWRMGDHRLAVGDCTDGDLVARMMDGALADAMWSDPPYGVSYTGKTKDALTIQGDDAAGLFTLLRDAFARCDAAMRPGAPYYIARPPGALSVTFGNAILGVPWHIHEELQWVKDSMVLGHSDYHLPPEARDGRLRVEARRAATVVRGAF